MTSQFVLRPIQNTDIEKNYLQLLSQLSPANDINPTEYRDFLNFITLHPETYYIVVIVDAESQTIVGTGTLLIEFKLIHHLGKVGHIEDIVIDDKYRGNGFGKMLIEHLKKRAEEMLCYKVILNCNEDKVGFYTKCGFIKKGVEMRYNTNIIR